MKEVLTQGAIKVGVLQPPQAEKVAKLDEKERKEKDAQKQKFFPRHGKDAGKDKGKGKGKSKSKVERGEKGKTKAYGKGAKDDEPWDGYTWCDSCEKRTFICRTSFLRTDKFHHCQDPECESNKQDGGNKRKRADDNKATSSSSKAKTVELIDDDAEAKPGDEKEDTEKKENLSSSPAKEVKKKEKQEKKDGEESDEDMS